MAVEQVLIVRHGETDYNVQRRWQGWLPTPLNAHGREQAQALAAYLRGHAIDAIYSSDSPRAYQTAQPVGMALGLTVQADERLREMNLGIFQGSTTEENWKKYPVELEAYQADKMDYVHPQGESRRELQERMYHAWEDITGKESGKTVMLVTHGGSIRLLLPKLFKDGVFEHGQFVVPNTSITTIERDGKGWRLVELGATPHLPDELPTQKWETPP